MLPSEVERIETLRQTWTDRFVKARPERPELTRFEGRVGRVVTVNWSGKAIVDFCDGAWYDIPASEEFLQFVDNPDEQKKYNPGVNSAQAIPERQG